MPVQPVHFQKVLINQRLTDYNGRALAINARADGRALAVDARALG